MKYGTILFALLLLTATLLGCSGEEAPMVLIPEGEGVGAFYLDRYEVTVAQFRKFKKDYKPSQYGYGNDRPATGMNWYEAKEYCESRGKRLPTEKEWGRACRGPEGYRYAYGDVYDTTKARTGLDLQDGMVRVGSYGPNGYGLYDMTGNVWEWTDSWQGRSEKYKLLLGGAWDSDQGTSTCRSRFRFRPTRWAVTLGFRCAKTP